MGFGRGRGACRNHLRSRRHERGRKATSHAVDLHRGYFSAMKYELSTSEVISLLPFEKDGSANAHRS